MERLDRLGWTAGFSFQAYGVHAGVRVNRTEAIEQIREYLPPGWKPSTSTIVQRLYSLAVAGEPSRPNMRRFHLLYGNVGRLGRSFDLESLLNLFESDLKLYIAEESPRRVFIHAGVVGWRGRAILIPGRSLSGKTTLVAELVRAGATYYSDEYAVLDSKGRVHPYPSQLGVRERGTLEQRKLTVESLCGFTGSKPLPIGLVLVTRYKEGARWRPRSLSPGESALALLDNTISIQKKPEVAFPILKEVAAHATVMKGVRGEAESVVNCLLNRLT